MKSTSDKIPAFEALTLKEKAQITKAITHLENLRISGKPPATEQIMEVCSQTDNLRIALDCYGAQIQKKDWL